MQQCRHAAAAAACRGGYFTRLIQAKAAASASNAR